MFGFRIRTNEIRGMTRIEVTEQRQKWQSKLIMINGRIEEESEHEIEFFQIKSFNT